MLRSQNQRQCLGQCQEYTYSTITSEPSSWLSWLGRVGVFYKREQADYTMDPSAAEKVKSRLARKKYCPNAIPMASTPVRTRLTPTAHGPEPSIQGRWRIGHSQHCTVCGYTARAGCIANSALRSEDTKKTSSSLVPAALAKLPGFTATLPPALG